MTPTGDGAVYAEMRLALLPALALLLAACGSSSSTHARPKDPPQGVGHGAPPPAWIETRAGDRWLGYSSYCWNHPEGNAMGHLCADFGAPKCSQRQVPELPVERGEQVRAHLGFEPLVGCGVLP